MANGPTSMRQRFLEFRSTKDLATTLGVTEDRLRWHSVRSNPQTRYKEFTIPKKGGGNRKILAPSPGLKLLQRQINELLQDVYQPRRAAFGFIKERDIKKNAQRHVGNRWVLNTDLADFFPSINLGRVRGLFLSKPYELPRSVATTLAQICCHDNQLPQGAPTSPVISNMICRGLDYDLASLASKHNCAYSRYADDITFSSNRLVFLGEIGIAQSLDHGGKTTPGDDLVAIITKHGFNINDQKTRLQRNSRRQMVTGLIVNRKVNVPRSFVWNLRGMLHAWEKYGLAAAQTTFVSKFYNPDLRAPFIGVPNIRDVIRGKISHLQFVRGKQDPLSIKFKEWFETLDPST